MEKKKRIGISWQHADLSLDRVRAYYLAVEATGGEAVALPLVSDEAAAVAALAGLDGLIMTGGCDLDPATYGENNEYCEEINPQRDVSDFLLLSKALAADLPTLCICRGCQVLNVLCGGTLYQDLVKQHPTAVTHRDLDRQHYVSHPIHVEEASHLYKALGSAECHFLGWHHQAVKDMGKDLRVVATSDDGGIEAIQLDSKSYVYGVQFHPEQSPQEAAPLFEALIANC